MLVAKRITLKEIRKRFTPSDPKAKKNLSPIVRRDGKYCVRSVVTGKILSCHDTLKEADARLKQISMFKHMRKK